MKVLTLLAAAALAVSIDARAAQHEGHQMPMPAQPQAAIDPAQCATSAREARDAAQSAVKRLETTRQNNDPAAMRTAVDDLQSALGFIQTRLAACTLPPPAAATPHTAAAPEAPMMQPGATTPAPAGGMAGMAGMDHSKMNMPAASPSKPAAPAAPGGAMAGMAGMDHAKMNMPAAPKATAKPAAPAAGMADMPGMDHSKMAGMDHSKMNMPAVAPSVATSVADLHCKVTMDAKSAPKAEYNGKTYYFCSESDRQKFVANPGKYVKDNPK